MSKRDEAYQKEVEITNELKRNLEGRWPSVLAAILPELAPAIQAKPGHHVQCPYHQKGRELKPTQFDFRTAKDFAKTGACFCTCTKEMTNGFQVIMYARRCSFIEAKQEIIEHLGGRITTLHIPASYVKEIDPREREREDEDRKRKIGRYWEQSIPLDHPDAAVARCYLENRGLTDVRMPVQNLRFHAGLEYYDDGKLIGRFPALVAMVRSVDGKSSTIHRTYLDPDGSGKAKVITDAGMDARKQYPSPTTHPVNGCAIKFDVEEFPALNLGEGIETMLGVRMLAPIPTWSCLNKILLEQVELPDFVKIVTVWADRDRSGAGQESAVKAVKRFREEGRRAIVMLPPFTIPEGEKGLDWNNVVQRHGIEVARRNMRFLEWKRRLKQIIEEIKTPEQSRRSQAS